MRNYQFVIEQFITNYLEKKVRETFHDKNYSPDFELGIADNGMLFVVRHDRNLAAELDEVVDFLNSEFEFSEDFAKFQ